MAVYILHFENKTFHAQHYVGWVEGTDMSSVIKRFVKHKSGSGSKLMRSVFLKGIKVVIANVYFNGDRKMERKLKNQKNIKRYCNVCKKDKI